MKILRDNWYKFSTTGSIESTVYDGDASGEIGTIHRPHYKRLYDMPV
jgi:hypothetical protein